MLSHGDGAGIYDLEDGKKQWGISGFKRVQTARLLKDGNFLIGQDGRNFVVVNKSGKVIKTIKAPKMGHLRLARIQTNGNILFAGNVYELVEITPSGKLVSEIRLKGKSYVGERLKDGTMVATAGGTTEIVVLDKAGKIIHKMGGKEEHQKVGLAWFSGFQAFDNGNVLVANWRGHGYLKKGPHLIEFTRDNKVVWQWYDSKLKTVTNVLVLKNDDQLLSVRAQNFIVNPSTGPVTNIVVENNSAEEFTGEVAAQFPKGWKVTPAKHRVVLKAGESKKLAFAIEKAVELQANLYSVKISVKSGDRQMVRTQEIVCSSAPYFKPQIDGELDEWKDSIPVKFYNRGRKTSVMMYWSRKVFNLAVEVEEEQFIGASEKSGVFDAIQFALAPADTITGKSVLDKSSRFEFLVTGSASRWGDDFCSLLLTQGDSLSKCNIEANPLRGQVDGAVVKVKRSSKSTIYEIAIPFSVMKALNPAPGREFCFSMLVHDPDGTGLRQFSSEMNLGQSKLNPLAWSSWKGVHWDKLLLLDSKLESGFCSSIH